MSSLTSPVSVCNERRYVSPSKSSGCILKNHQRWIERATAQLKEIPIVTFSQPLTYDSANDRIWAKFDAPKEGFVEYLDHSYCAITSDALFSRALSTDVAFSAFESGLHLKALESTTTYFRISSWNRLNCSLGDSVCLDVTHKETNAKMGVAIYYEWANSHFFNPETGVLRIREIDKFCTEKFPKAYIVNEKVPETFQLPVIKI